MNDSKLLHVIFNMLKASTAFGSFKAMMSHGTIHNNDFERNRAFAALLRHCFELLQHGSIIVTLKIVVAIFSCNTTLLRMF